MIILGLNLYHADSSAALLVDGDLVAAASEERFSRRRHFGGFPKEAIRFCLDRAGARLDDVDHIAVGRDTRANLERKIRHALANPTKILNLLKIRARGLRSADLRSLVSAELEVDPRRLRFEEHHVEHHLAHIASSYLVSGVSRAAGFSFDGSGDFVSVMMADCIDDKIDVKRRIFVPHSLGSLYTAFCQFLGYGDYGDEGKVLGLAAWGADVHGDLLEKAIRLTRDGFRLDLDYFHPFGHDRGMTLEEDGEVRLSRHFSEKLPESLGPPRERHGEISRRDLDIACSLQKRFEAVLFHLLGILQREVPCPDLVLAGGCALNSTANGKILDETGFRSTFIQPAPGDEGLAVGAALYIWCCVLGQERRYEMLHARLGPEFADPEIRAALDAAGLRYRPLEGEALLEAAADRLVQGDVVGWFQGRMEWGPRALGARSILAHPGRPEMRDILNARIKHREKFRPFAPSILEERQADYFEQSHPSPFMLQCSVIRPERRQELAAVTHADNTGRLQSVTRQDSPQYHDLIETFGRKTGTPVLLNTSFNENEPIVCRPEEAIACFLRTPMDVLGIGSYLVRKGDNEGLEMTEETS